MRLIDADALREAVRWHYAVVAVDIDDEDIEWSDVYESTLNLIDAAPTVSCGECVSWIEGVVGGAHGFATGVGHCAAVARFNIHNDLQVPSSFGCAYFERRET